MYQKIKDLESTLIAILVINVVLASLLFFGLPEFIFLCMLVIINVLSLSYIMKRSKVLQDEIKDSRNLLPHSVNQAIEMDEYCILMYDKDSKKVIWENEFFADEFGSFVNQRINDVFDGFLVDENRDEYLLYNDNYFSVLENEETFLFKNVTEYVMANKNYVDNKDCVLFIKIDSLDDIGAALSETNYQSLVQSVRNLINDTVNDYDCILRRYKNDSYIVIVKNKEYENLITSLVELLEKVKDASSKYDDRITLSIGCANGFDTLKETESEAGKALDMALARGGDQLVKRQENMEYKFYGGNSEAVEKRNRVKVRMIANTLETLIQDSSKVILMPHQEADLDALGACFGMAKFVSLNNKDVYICITPDRLESGTRDAYNLLELDKMDLLRSAAQILDEVDEDTLLIVLDTSNIEIFESRQVYERVEKRIVIDHHRKSKDFIKNPLLVYIEPYASSSVELITELLVFQNKSFKLGSDVATLMLAGMMVDTSYFTVRTGVRTFEAATTLKDNGASPLQAKEILQVSRDTYQKKLAIVSDAKFICDDIAVSKYTEEPVTRSLLAQAAVELLDVKDTKATFVMGYLEDGSVGLSARSNDDYNVQMIVEHFGGGGHFSMAAAQLNGDINEIEQEIVEYIIKLQNDDEEEDK